MMFKQALNWLKDNWLWTLLNVIAPGIMLWLLSMINVSWISNERNMSVFDPTFMDSGIWAIRFLLFSLAITPIYRIFGWRWAIPLRKPAGLWAFAFAALHFSYYLAMGTLTPAELLQTPYMMIGFVALSMLAVMAITSNRWAMKWLGRTWKRLHRLVYAVAVLVILHVILALNGGKKAWMNPFWYREFVLYGAIAGVLLLLRVSMIRNTAVSILTLGRVKIKRKRENTAGGLAAE